MKKKFLKHSFSVIFMVKRVALKAFLCLDMVLAFSQPVQSQATHTTIYQLDNTVVSVLNKYFNTEDSPDPLAAIQYYKEEQIALDYNGQTVVLAPDYLVQNGLQAIFPNDVSAIAIFENQNLLNIEKEALESNGIKYFNADTVAYEEDSISKLKDLLDNFIENKVGFFGDLTPPATVLSVHKHKIFNLIAHPNPTNGIVKVSGNNACVYTMTGQKITVPQTYNESTRFSTLHLEGLPTGIYIINSQGKEGLINVYKIIKK